MRTTSVGAYADTPGTFCRGNSWAFGALAGGLRATLSSGVLLDEDMKDLMSAWRRAFCSPPHPSLIDATELVGMGPRAFESMLSTTEGHLSVRATAVTRQALVIGRNFAGTLARGYIETFAQPHLVRCFDSKSEALRWLQCSDAWPELSVMAAQIGDIPTRTRNWILGQPLTEVTIASAAAGLGISARTLQRRLSDLGTTFSNIESSARVERAKALLRDTQDSLAAIALQVGYGSQSAFNQAFVRQVGTTPGRWRREHTSPPTG